MTEEDFPESKHDAIAFLLEDIRKDMLDYPVYNSRICTLSEGHDDMEDRVYVIYINTINYNYFIHFYPEIVGHTYFFVIGPIHDDGMKAYHYSGFSLEQYEELHMCLEDYFERPLL